MTPSYHPSLASRSRLYMREEQPEDVLALFEKMREFMKDPDAQESFVKEFAQLPPFEQSPVQSFITATEFACDVSYSAKTDQSEKSKEGME